MAIPCCNATRSQPLERLAVFADLKGTWFRCFQMFVYAIVYANALNIFEKWTICCPICNILRVQTQIVPCFDYWVAGFLMASKSCWYYRLLESDGKPWKTADVGVVSGICFPGREAWMLSLPWKPPGLVALPSLWNMKQWCIRFGKNSGKLISTRF
jgi:hypothetical protein